jgi:Kef-type K+ transport system membrane component KefB/mannitol/fructose-specific phosphotransferase system IIA component (Ntr-type)
LPAGYIGQAGGRLGFALFIAAIMTISAMSATAHVLQDLHMYKTDLGFLIMCALSVNDILGWLVFTLILGFFTQTELSGMRVLVILGATCGFTVFCLTLGRWLANRGISALKRLAMPEPGSSLTLIVLLGLICGAITAWIGIHALFGFFIAGIMAGEARDLSERTRQVIAQMVHAIFIPIFFASIGLKLDVVANFDWGLVAFMLAIGVAGRYAGAWCGVATTRQPRENRHLISIAHVPGGEMQIVVSLLALQNLLIRESVFVAVVCSAVVSSIIAGPWMTLALRRRKAVQVLEYCARERVMEVTARTRDAALRELCACAADALPGVAPEALCDAVQRREDEMGTGIGHGLAVPHARLRGVTRPVLVIGRARMGIEWNAPDGDPARVLFLLLTPAEDADVQLQALRIIATVFADANLRARVQEAADARDVWRIVQDALQTHTIVRRT